MYYSAMHTNTTTSFQVRNMMTDETTGWAARAMQVGLKVSSRDGKFGDVISLVKDAAGAFVQVTQNSRNGRKLDASTFTPEQLAIVAKLQQTGLIV